MSATPLLDIFSKLLLKWWLQKHLYGRSILQAGLPFPYLVA